MTELKSVDLHGVSGGFGFGRPRARPAAPAPAAPAPAAAASNIFPQPDAGAPDWAKQMVAEANDYAAHNQPNGSQYGGNGTGGTQVA